MQVDERRRRKKEKKKCTYCNIIRKKHEREKKLQSTMRILYLYCTSLLYIIIQFSRGFDSTQILNGHNDQSQDCLPWFFSKTAHSIKIKISHTGPITI